jgi:probable HAF family extracellular repeat protein
MTPANFCTVSSLSNGSFSTLDDPAQNQPTTDAVGINDAGQIVGSYEDASGEHGFLRSGNIFVSIDDPSATNDGILETGTAALGINDAGEIVGEYDDASGSHGFLRTSGGLFGTLDAPLGKNTVANDINTAGQIVGSFEDTRGVEHGFLHFPGTPGAVGRFTFVDDPLATLGTNAIGINDAGQIVGSFRTGNKAFCSAAAPTLLSMIP